MSGLREESIFALMKTMISNVMKTVWEPTRTEEYTWLGIIARSLAILIPLGLAIYLTV